MSIRIDIPSILESDDIDTFNLRLNVEEGKKKLLYEIDANDPEAKILLRLILKAQIDGTTHELAQYLIDTHGTPEIRTNAKLIVTTEGITSLAAANLPKKTKKGELSKVQDLYNPRSWISRETFLKRYPLNGHLFKIPYTNYLDNDNEGNCVLNYCKQMYTNHASVTVAIDGIEITKINNTRQKIAEKSILKYFSGGVTMSNIKEFTDAYKIPCTIYNIAGKCIYCNKLSKSSNYSQFVAIIANNHLYPFNGKSPEKTKPELNEEITYDDVPEDGIIIKNNMGEFSYMGKHEKEFNWEREMDFFAELYPNFSYKCEKDVKIKHMAFNILRHGGEDQELFAVDMNKSYWTTAHEIIPSNSRCGIFNACDVWEKYDRGTIKPCSYYLLHSVERLTGYISNILLGTEVLYFIERGLISKQMITFVKHAQSTIEWSVITGKMDNLMKTVEEKIDGLELSEEEKNKLRSTRKKQFAYDNGILGKTSSVWEQEISNIVAADFNLLNDCPFGGENYVSWKTWKRKPLKENQEHTSFKQSSISHKYKNTVNIYNNIVGNCRLFMAKALHEVQKLNPDANLLKIQVDCLCFDREFKLPEHLVKYFKVENEPKYWVGSPRIVMHNGNEIIAEVEKELVCFDKNISYHGPPGTGKTFKVMKEHTYDFAMAVTNVCCRNISTNKIAADTICSTLNTCSENQSKYFKKFTDKTIWLDEFSMVDPLIWDIIFVLSNNFNTKFIISGDINQMAPVNFKKINMNNVFYKKVMGALTMLTIDYRNCPQLIKLRDFILNNDELTTVYELGGSYSGEDYTKFDAHLAYTHKTCESVNLKIMKARGYVFENINGKWNCSRGVYLSAKKSIKNMELFKNDAYKVINVLDDGFALLNIRTKNERNFKNNEMSNFELGFCLTIHAAQGLTILTDLCIHDIDKMLQTYKKELLYTAVTRVKNIGQLRLYWSELNKIKGEELKTDKEEDVFIDYKIQPVYEDE